MLTIRQVRTVGPKEKTALRTLAFIRAGCMCNPRSPETGQQHEGGICGYR